MGMHFQELIQSAHPLASSVAHTVVYHWLILAAVCVCVQVIDAELTPNIIRAPSTGNICWWQKRELEVL